MVRQTLTVPTRNKRTGSVSAMSWSADESASSKGDLIPRVVALARIHKSMITREIQSQSNMGRGAYDTTGAPKPKPKPTSTKKR
ncbi:unnamed protein product [Zymoseptoria tritici ST99CH_3D7]|uniref:Uncharacterized protein n=1 Tax=Zymoseptoria tritici (strain ST99CH_3D7) TaxID=1276538 RepID=A0A1X7RT79_ZYMT9|nr:unnamed protein product [Zymoseptoria tritici ST99CH_3D7]